MWKIRIFSYFLHWRHFDVIMTSFDVIFAIFTSFLEKFKLMLNQQLMPLFTTCWVWKIRLFNNYSNLTSLWHHDVIAIIWCHFCHFDVIFRKMKLMLHQQLIPPFTSCWVWKIRLFNNYSNLASLWRHLTSLLPSWRHFL